MKFITGIYIFIICVCAIFIYIFIVNNYYHGDEQYINNTQCYEKQSTLIYSYFNKSTGEVTYKDSNLPILTNCNNSTIYKYKKSDNNIWIRLK